MTRGIPHVASKMATRSRRKGARTAKTNAAGPRGRGKAVQKSPPSPVQWEWQNDAGWATFDPKHSADITAAFIQEKASMELTVASNVKLEVDFGSMTQKNMMTGWKRNIRCVPSKPHPLPSASQWEWQDEHGSWNPYSSEVQRLLRACRLCSVEQWEIEASGRCYRVEMGAGSGEMVQVNVETGVKREVRCTATAAPATDPNGNPSGSASKETGASLNNQDEEGASNKRITRSQGRTQRKKPKSEEVHEEGSGVSKRKDGKEGGVSDGSSRGSSHGKEGGASDGKEGCASDGSSRESGDGDSKVEETDSRVLVTYRGKVPVDYECHQKIGKAHVLHEDGEHWDATLNQTNLKNNNNKFYILQLLQDNSSKRYSVWFRWGRVGKAGQHSLIECGGDLDEAKSLFTKKFRDKTCNDWTDRGSFIKHAGKYDLLSMDYEAKEETDVGTAEEVDGGTADKPEPSKPVQSKLDMRVQALLELICDVQAMEDTVLEMKYDAKKAPLGKLTADQVKSGYSALKKIEECINRSDFGDRLVQACDQFYTRIPHSFGMRRPPLIRTKEEVKEKLALLETLSDIQIALKVLSGGDKKENPLDRHYQGLNCTLAPVDHEDEAFRMVEKYVKQTHAKTHNQYQLEVKEVFGIERHGEAQDFKDVGNRLLLWHGSRLSNWVGILSQGLRVAPPEAPVTGYMFGKGIYFADMCSKSANYCFASKSRNEALALLCDVSLGNTQDLLAANYSADQLPKGKFSTKGLGKIAPNAAQNITLSDGCIVPLGTPVDTGVHNPSGYTLNYNEYIVYDPKQVKMKYLARLKFHFH